MTIQTIENEILGDASASTVFAKDAEEKFQKMKQLATQAEWPASLTPEIVAIDKEWQSAKEAVNEARNASVFSGKSAPAAQQMAIVATKIDAMIVRLEAYVKTLKPAGKTTNSAASPGKGPSASGKPSGAPGESPGSFLDMISQQYGPLPLWGWGALGTVAVAVGIGVLHFRRP